MSTKVSVPIEKDQTESAIYGDLLHRIALGLVVVSAGFVLFSSFFFRELVNRALLLGGVASLVGLLVIWAIPHGYIRLAGAILVISIWLTGAYLTYSAGGLIAPLLFGNIILILIASIIAGPAGGLAVVVASIVYGAFLAVSEDQGQLPSVVTYSPYARLLIYAFFIVLAWLLQRVSVQATTSAIQQAQTTEMHYRLFLENIPLVSYINDLSVESRTTYVSPQVEDMLGYSPDEFLQDPFFWRKILHSDDETRVSAENQRTTQTGDSFLLDYRLIKKNGDVIWVRDEALLARNEKGEPQYWLGVWTDITQRKLSEKSLEEVVRTLIARTGQLMTASEVSNAASSILGLPELLTRAVELIRSHFNYYYVGIFLIDNQSNTAVLRAASGENGKKLLELNHSLLIENSSMIGWCILNNDARIALDIGIETIRFDNPYLPLSRSEIALPLRARGKVIGGMSIQSEKESAFTTADITALQTMADQVANAIETARLFDERMDLINELEAKNSELERFTYTVSHDLKSPLVTIRGYLGYLKQDVEKNDFSRFQHDLDRISKATDTMQALLQDLLDLSRVGRIINPPEKISIQELVAEAVNLISSPATADKFKIIVHSGMPIVRCDRVRIVEVLQNLLSNAIKFMGDQPDPIVEVGSNGVEQDTGFAIIFVRDNGMGIDKRFQEQVFGLFNRLHPEKEGTGIGLALAKRIIDVHGGHIWLESEGVNKGATFYFTLPLADASTP